MTGYIRYLHAVIASKHNMKSNKCCDVLEHDHWYHSAYGKTWTGLD